MTAILLTASVGHGSKALWYLTRSTGLVALVLLSATLILGIVASLGWTTDRWPRFLSQGLHRNLSLLCLGLITIHVVTTVADGYVPITYLDAVIPFRTPYRPLWVGLGALAFDLLLAVAITSGLRRNIGRRTWRAIHIGAYLCWPIAAMHALGAGSDARLPIVFAVEVACIAMVGAAVAWRLVAGRSLPTWTRLGAGAAGALAIGGVVLFATSGPLRPGWSHRAGTSPTVLAQLESGRVASSSPSPSTSTPAPTSPSPSPSPSPTGAQAGSASPGLPLSTPPFTREVSGSYRTSTSTTTGQITVLLTVQVVGVPDQPLVVELRGEAAAGGVAMSSSQVTWGAATGTVTALRGSDITTSLAVNGHSMTLTLHLDLVRATGSLTGTVARSTTGSQH
jgi:DMSO/TMAO reductase YedYZ heme-binding membrane subunit